MGVRGGSIARGFCAPPTYGRRSHRFNGVTHAHVPRCAGAAALRHMIFPPLSPLAGGYVWGGDPRWDSLCDLALTYGAVILDRRPSLKSTPGSAAAGCSTGASAVAASIAGRLGDGGTKPPRLQVMLVTIFT